MLCKLLSTGLGFRGVPAVLSSDSLSRGISCRSERVHAGALQTAGWRVLALLNGKSNVLTIE